MADFLASPFVQTALIASLFLSVSAGIIGSIIVANKNVFLAGGVAHSAFGGVGVALFFGFSAIAGALVAALMMAIFMVYAHLKHKGRLDTFIAISWAFGMALGIVLIELTPGYKINMESYLFGSLAFTTWQDIYLMIGFDIILLGFVSLYYREILGILYDSEFCALKNLKTHIFTIGIFVFTSVGVVLGMRLGGLILVISILSIPAYIAMMFARNLKLQFMISSVLCLVLICLGFGVSYMYNVASGACIVLLCVVAFFGAICVKYLTKRIYNGK